VSVYIDHIHLRRLRGTGAELNLKRLARDINIIHGPNGVGKSTLALALQEVLWPGSTELARPSLDAELDVDGTPWRVRIEAGYAEHDGPGGARPDLGSADRRTRYLLALHDLVVPDSQTDAAFAAHVLRESLGGHDLDAVAATLGFYAKPTQPQGLKKEVREAKHARQAALERARALEAERQDLARLRTEREHAKRARQEANILDRAREFVQARQKLEHARADMEAFPAVMELLRGNEKETLDDLESRKGDLDGKISREEREIERIGRVISERLFPGGTPDPARRGHWKGLVEQAEDVERTLRDVQADRIKAEVALRELDVRLAETAGAAEVTGISRDMATTLDRLFREWVSLQGRETVLRQQQQALEMRRVELDEPAAKGENVARGRERMSTDALHAAITRLEDWLRAPKEAQAAESAIWWVVLLAGLLAVTGILAFLWAGPLFLAAPALALVLLILFWRRKRPAEASRRSDVERMWNGTEVPAPAAWTEQEVVKTLRMLLGQVVEDKRRNDEQLDIGARLEKVAEDMVHARQERAHLASQMEALGREMGFPLTQRGADDDESLTARGIWLLSVSEELVLRGTLSARLTEAQAAESAAEEQLRKLLDELGVLSDVLDLDSVPDSASAARAALEQLQARIQELDAAKQERDASTRKLEDEWRPEREDVESRIIKLFEDLGLNSGDEAALIRLLEAHEAWKEAGTALRVAEAQVQQAEERLHAETRPEGMEPVEALLACPVPELEDQMQRARERAATYDDLVDRIGKITLRMGAAVDNQEVAQAAMKLDAAKEKLQHAVDDNVRSVIGNEIVRFVRDKTVEDTLPQVFVRARELLASFTAGALELVLDLTPEQPRFLAKTDGSSTARPVAELSVGERVQLLMAVRMAFLEQEETSPLPLILDEALGTTDDVRARAIVSALMDLAGRGRQLFYFTAQTDEVAKWMEVLGRLDGAVEDRVMDLAAVRRGSASEAAPLPTSGATWSEPDIPAPGGQDYITYGRRLGVPGIRPHEEGIDAVHIWHVLEGSDDVYRLLRRRVETVGQYRVLVRAAHPVTGSSADRDAVLARVDLLDDAMSLWKRGRGRPLTRDVLQEAPGVSDRKLDEVWALTRQKEYDARALIDGLEAGEVSRFREDKREELRGYLEEKGFIAGEDPLSAEDALMELQARHPDAGVSCIERVVSVLWRTEP